MITPDKASIESIGAKHAKCVAYSGDRILCRVLGNLKMLVSSWDEGISPHLAFDGYWESWVTAVVWSTIRPGMYVVNVGANVGYYTLLASRIVGPEGRVDAFEPNPEMAQLLRSNIALNGMTETTKVFECAVAEKAGVVIIRAERSAPGGGSICRKDEGGHFNIVKGVPAVTLTEHCDRRPDVIICDAEGAEGLVLAGAEEMIRRTVTGPTLIMEWSASRQEAPNEAVDRLLSLGYRVSEINDMGGLSPIKPEQLRTLDHDVMIYAKRHPGGAP